MNDPIGDMLTRIRNAQMRRRPKVATPASNLRARVLDVLAEEGYIRGYSRVEFRFDRKVLGIQIGKWNYPRLNGCYIHNLDTLVWSAMMRAGLPA